MGMFDHLIPKEQASAPQGQPQKGGGLFDHLIPAAPVEAAPSGRKPVLELTVRPEGVEAPKTQPATVPFGAVPDNVDLSTQMPFSIEQGLRGLDNTARIIANGATFGMADRLAGYMNGTGKEEERAKTARARDELGAAQYAADAAGMIVPAKALGSVVQGVAGLAANAAPRIASIFAPSSFAGQTANMAAQGATLGTASALGNDEDVTNGALAGVIGGAVGNVAGTAVSKGLEKVAGAFKSKPVVPGIDDLRQQANAAYAKADAAGVVYTPNAVNRIVADVQKDLVDKGFHPKLQPNVAVALEELSRIGRGNVTLKGLDTARKIVQNGYIPGNKSNNSMLKGIQDKIDEMVSRPQAGDVLAGNGAEAGAAIKEARTLWQRLTKAEKIEYAIRTAEQRAASTGSGGNADNAIRQKIRALAEKERNWTPDERVALEKVINGTSGQNLLRLLGKLSPGGNGLTTMLQLGAVSYNPSMALGAAGGAGAKFLADSATKANVAAASKIARAGGSNVAAFGAPNPYELLAQQSREPLSRALMGGSMPTFYSVLSGD